MKIMERIFWKFDAWANRPQLGYLRIWLITKTMWLNTTKIGAMFYFLAMTIFYTILCGMYWITFPFAVINEWIRS